MDDDQLLRSLEDIAQSGSSARHRPGSRVSSAASLNSSMNPRKITTPSTMEVLPPEIISQEDSDMELEEYVSSGEESDHYTDESRGDEGGCPEPVEGGAATEKEEKENSPGQPSETTSDDELEYISDPKMRAAIKKMKRLDKVLAAKTRREKEVKRERILLERRLQQELERARPQGHQELKEVTVNATKYLALMPPPKHNEGVDLSESPSVTPVFPTQPADFSTAPPHSARSDRTANSKSSTINGSDISDDRKTETSQQKYKGKRKSGKKKHHQSNTAAADKDFIQRNIDLASDANNLIAMTDDEKKRLDELLQDVEMMKALEEEPDGEVTTGHLPVQVQSLPGIGFQPDSEDSRALKDIDGRLQALLSTPDDFLSLHSSPLEPTVHQPSLHEAQSVHTEFYQSLDLMELGEKALWETKLAREQKEKLDKIEEELSTLYHRVVTEMDQPVLSQHQLDELLEQCARASSRATTETHSLASQRSSPRQPLPAPASQNPVRLPDEVLQRLLAEARGETAAAQAALEDTGGDKQTPSPVFTKRNPVEGDRHQQDMLLESLSGSHNHSPVPPAHPNPDPERPGSKNAGERSRRAGGQRSKVSRRSAAAGSSREGPWRDGKTPEATSDSRAGSRSSESGVPGTQQPPPPPPVISASSGNYSPQPDDYYLALLASGAFESSTGRDPGSADSLASAGVAGSRVSASSSAARITPGSTSRDPGLADSLASAGVAGSRVSASSSASKITPGGAGGDPGLADSLASAGVAGSRVSASSSAARITPGGASGQSRERGARHPAPTRSLASLGVVASLTGGAAQTAESGGSHQEGRDGLGSDSPGSPFLRGELGDSLDSASTLVGSSYQSWHRGRDSLESDTSSRRGVEDPLGASYQSTVGSRVSGSTASSRMMDSLDDDGRPPLPLATGDRVATGRQSTGDPAPAAATGSRRSTATPSSQGLWQPNGSTAESGQRVDRPTPATGAGSSRSDSTARGGPGYPELPAAGRASSRRGQKPRYSQAQVSRTDPWASQSRAASQTSTLGTASPAASTNTLLDTSDFDYENDADMADALLGNTPRGHSGRSHDPRSHDPPVRSRGPRRSRDPEGSYPPASASPKINMAAISVSKATHSGKKKSLSSAGSARGFSPPLI